MVLSHHFKWASPTCISGTGPPVQEVGQALQIRWHFCVSAVTPYLVGISHLRFCCACKCLENLGNHLEMNYNFQVGKWLVYTIIISRKLACTLQISKQVSLYSLSMLVYLWLVYLCYNYSTDVILIQGKTILVPTSVLGKGMHVNNKLTDIGIKNLLWNCIFLPIIIMYSSDLTA